MTINLLSPSNAKYQAEASQSDALMHPWKENSASLYTSTITLDLPDDCKAIIMGGVVEYCTNQPSMKSETLPWKVMRRIRLLTVESQEQEEMRLTEKVHEIQRLSSLNLKVGFGHQVATKGRINWEVVFKDIENLRTKLSVFCAQEGIYVTKSEELHIKASYVGISKTYIQNKHQVEN